MIDSPALRASLRCLIHPASLAGVTLLLVNDHLLKSHSPSWITGKLSDVAGLFFFPFLLALLFSLLPGFRRLSREKIGGLAVGVTALWFALAKGTVLGNALTVDLVSALVGYRASIVLDPTDLLGLLSLLPAWLLWRYASADDRPVSVRAALPAVIFASFASLATSGVDRLVGTAQLRILDGKLYTFSGGIGNPFVTIDNGRTWKNVEIPPLDDPETLLARADRGDTSARRQLATMNVDSLRRIVQGSWGLHNPGLLARAYHPKDSNVQVRGIYGQRWLERSDDGGETWRRIWEIAPERESYLDRQTESDPSPMLWDVVFTPDGSGTIVAALGAGVLVIDSIGRVSQHPVGSQGVVLPSAPSIGAAFNMLTPEWAGLLGASLVIGAIVSVAGWRMTIPEEIREKGERDERPGGPLGCLLIVVPFMTISTVVAQFDLFEGLLLLAFAIVGVPVGVIALVSIWLRISGLDAAGDQPKRIVRTSMIATIATLFLPAVPFLLWATGSIPSHTTATLIALVIGAIITTTALIKLRSS